MISAARATWLTVLLLLPILGCGGAPPPAVAGPAGAPSSGGNVNGVSAPAPLGTPAVRPAIALAPGFLPRPTVARGTAGGPVDGGSLYEYCIGSMPRTPQHVLDVSAPLPYLAIGAYGNVDLTIAVHLPDGSWLCNDDWDGLNPRVEGPIGRGRVEVFVGTYGSASQGGGDYEYTVGFSEDPSFTPSMLPPP